MPPPEKAKPTGPVSLKVIFAIKKSKIEISDMKYNNRGFLMPKLNFSLAFLINSSIQLYSL